MRVSFSKKTGFDCLIVIQLFLTLFFCCSPAFSNPSRLTSGDYYYYPIWLTVFQSKLFFSANDDINGRELWVYDVVNTPKMVADTNSNPYTPYGLPILDGSFSPAYFTDYNSKLYFSANDGINGAELWVYDGVNLPTMVADINPAEVTVTVTDIVKKQYEITGCSFPRNLTVFNSKLYLSADNGTNGTELWAYDGEHAPNMVTNFSYPEYPDINNLTVFNSKLYFKKGYELFAYDGVNAPSLLMDLQGTSNYDLQGFDLVVFNSKLYFAAYDETYGLELWVFDGVNKPTLVADINPNGSSSPRNFIVYNSKLYFAAYHETYGLELWVYDGINKPTLAADINPSGNSSPDNFIVYNSKLYFAAYHETYGLELWAYDGINYPTMVADINETVFPPGDSDPSFLTVFKSKLYFQANDGISGTQLWVYDSDAKVGEDAVPVAPMLNLLLLKD